MKLCKALNKLMSITLCHNGFVAYTWSELRGKCRITLTQRGTPAKLERFNLRFPQKKKNLTVYFMD